MPAHFFLSYFLPCLFPIPATCPVGSVREWTHFSEQFQFSFSFQRILVQQLNLLKHFISRGYQNQFVGVFIPFSLLWWRFMSLGHGQGRRCACVRACVQRSIYRSLKIPKKIEPRVFWRPLGENMFDPGAARAVMVVWVERRRKTFLLRGKKVECIDSR